MTNSNQQFEILATPQDVALLIQNHPLAAAQLKAIVLERQKAQLEMELVALRNGAGTAQEAEPVESEVKKKSYA